MGGFEILMVLVGAAIGAGVVYWWQENRINRLEKDHKRALRKMVESIDRNYAERSYTPPPANTQAAPPSEIPNLPPTIMQVAASAARIPQEIATPPEVAPTEPRSLEAPEVSVVASLPTEPLVDLSKLSNAVAAEAEDLPSSSPDPLVDLDLSELSDIVAEVPEELTPEPLDQTAELPELSGLADAMPEALEEDLPLSLLDRTADLSDVADVADVADTTLELPDLELPEDLTLDLIDRTADLADVSDLSDVMPEISEDFTLTSLEQTNEMLLPETYLEEPSQQITEAQPLLTQIFDEPPFEIDELAAIMPSSPTVTLDTPPGTLTQSNKITTKIATWGQLANPRYIPQLLGYANHPDASVREQVATGLGQIAAANAMHAHTPQLIPVLERLSRDRHLETRYQAIVTLGQIKSDRVIPILTSALREPSSKLVKAASSALNKLKHYSSSEPKLLELPKQILYKKPLR